MIHYVDIKCKQNVLNLIVFIHTKTLCNAKHDTIYCVTLNYDDT